MKHLQTVMLHARNVTRQVRQQRRLLVKLEGELAVLFPGVLTEEGEPGPGVREPGIEGVTVNLIDSVSGDILATTTTDPDGAYLFSGLPPGDYEVLLTPAGGSEPEVPRVRVEAGRTASLRVVLAE